MSAPGRDVGFPMHEYEVRGRSMRRVLDAGDLIQVRPSVPRALRWGDLVVFLSNEKEYAGSPRVQLVVHRFLWMRAAPEGVRLWTMGDALRLALDPPSPGSSLIGKVVAVKRGDGRWRDLDGAAGRAGHLTAGLASVVLFWLQPFARGLLSGAYAGCRRFPRLRLARRILLQAAMVLEGY